MRTESVHRSAATTYTGSRTSDLLYLNTLGCYMSQTSVSYWILDTVSCSLINVSHRPSQEEGIDYPGHNSATPQVPQTQ